MLVQTIQDEHLLQFKYFRLLRRFMRHLKFFGEFVIIECLLYSNFSEICFSEFILEGLRS
jgi:hypothetical protein